MKYLDEEIIFIYNAKSDLFSTLSDFAHKIFFPATYPCSLCKLAYGNIRVKKKWTSFLESLPHRQSFFHSDDAPEMVSAFLEELPVILIRTNHGGLDILMSSKELNQLGTLVELIDTLGRRLEEYKTQ